MKASDQAGNYSATPKSTTITTGDHVAPAFAGLDGDTVKVDYRNRRINLHWEPSSAPDLKHYRLRVTLPGQDEPQELYLTAHDYSLGGQVELREGDYTFAVDACDDAKSAGFADADNCSSTDPITKRIADLTPPQEFVGIKSATLPTLGGEGAATIQWHPPAHWQDYAQFFIYEVGTDNKTLTEVGVCACDELNCEKNPRTSCTLTDLRAASRYVFHVTAADANGNQSQDLTPVITYSKVLEKTLDESKPKFTSQLELGPAPEFLLSWAVATDNQDPKANTLQYRIYRSEGQEFINALEPPTDKLLKTTDKNSYGDAGQDQALKANTDYYYTVCAVDSSGNERCDGAVKRRKIPDNIPPTIGGLSFDTDPVKGTDWSVSFFVKDNLSEASQMRFELHRFDSSEEDGPKDFSPEDSTKVQTLAKGKNCTPQEDGYQCRFTGEKGVAKKLIYANYKVVATDEDENSMESALATHVSDLVLRVTGTRPTAATRSTMIVIEGRGFSPGDIGYLGEHPCQRSVVASPSELLCWPPDSILAYMYNVSVKKPGFYTSEGQARFHLTDHIAKGLLEIRSKNNPRLICEHPQYWNEDFAAGNGTIQKPYYICHAQHFESLRQLNSQEIHVKLGTDIYLGDVENFEPLSHSEHATFFEGDRYFGSRFDGRGHTIYNTTINYPDRDGVGFFGHTAAITSNMSNSSFTNHWNIRNANFVNLTVTGRDYVGGLVGAMSRLHHGAINNVAVKNGHVTGRDKVGGLVGFATRPIINASFEGQITARDKVGGIVGLSGVNHYEDNNLNAFEPTKDDMANTFFLERVRVRADIQTTGSHTGGIAGILRSSGITHAEFQGSITTAGHFAGGIAGYVYGSRQTISKVRFQGQLTATNPSSTVGFGGIIGGLSGGHTGTDSPFCPGGCFPATTRITAQDKVQKGFATSNRNFHLSRALVNGAIKGGSKTGGIVGHVFGPRLKENTHSPEIRQQIQLVRNNAQVTGTSFVGGLMGYLQGGHIHSSENTGLVEGDSAVGSLVGSMRASSRLNDSVASGHVTVKTHAGGGMVGEVALLQAEIDQIQSVLWKSHTFLTIERVLSTADVTKGPEATAVAAGVGLLHSDRTGLAFAKADGLYLSQILAYGGVTNCLSECQPAVGLINLKFHSGINESKLKTSKIYYRKSPTTSTWDKHGSPHPDGYTAKLPLHEHDGSWPVQGLFPHRAESPVLYQAIFSSADRCSANTNVIYVVAGTNHENLHTVTFMDEGTSHRRQLSFVLNGDLTTRKHCWQHEPGQLPHMPIKEFLENPM